MCSYQNMNDYNQISEKIIGCAFKVSNFLGCGFLEKVYERALVHEMRKANLNVFQQHPIEIFYDGISVGHYVSDIIVEESVLVELKTVKSFEDIHLAQCLNYLKATGLPLCLLLNFGTPRLQIKRIIL